MASSDVQIDLLTRENYDTWKIQMEAFLLKNNVWEFVSGEKLKPEIVPEETASAIEAKAWEIEDQKAKLDIILSIEPCELIHIKDCDTSREMWTKLKSIYQSRESARKVTLLKQIMLHKMTDSDDVCEHLRKFHNIVDKLSEMEVQINRDLLTVMLLYSLPSSFEDFRCAIESCDELPDLEELQIKIIEEFDAKKNETLDVGNNTMLAKEQEAKPQNAAQRNVSKQNKSNKKKNKSKRQFKCYRCEKVGHKVAECPEVRKDKDSTNAADKISLYAETEFAPAVETVDPRIARNSGKWYLDSGSTTHMGNDDAKFESILESCSGSVKLAIETASTPIRGKGLVSITADIDGRSRDLKAGDVLCVPELRTNLLSVGRITEKDNIVIFEKKKAEVIDKYGNTVLIADQEKGLYHVREADGKLIADAASVTDGTSEEVRTDKWHRRMGHLNFRDLVKCDQEGTVQGMKLGNLLQEFDCETCFRGKMEELLPLPKNLERASKLLEIIHSAIIGPMRVDSNGGARFTVTFIDDYSRWGEIRMLKRKDEVFRAFKEYKSLVEKQHGCKIKFLQSNNRAEYVNKTFDNFLKKNGIRRKLTVIHTPKQEDVAERYNRTLMDMTRCLLIESRLPTSFWGEAINTTNYIHNRCPSRSLGGRTAHEKWTGKVPDVGHFREFGSKVFIIDRTLSEGKLESRAKKGVLIGYSEKSKAYRIWVSDEERINIAEDVKFMAETKSRKKDSVKTFSYNDHNIKEIWKIFPPVNDQHDV